jgi:XRE family transcriptional regulator, aerobic/anaerobic benzoate catabolism transcriptional regulator
MHYTTRRMPADRIRSSSSRRHAARQAAPLLAAVGSAVRAARRGRGLTRRTLAERSGVSERFLAQLEAGAANISLLRLADLARALEAPLLGLLSHPLPHADAGHGASPRLALVGLRGAGKSTLGRRLARRLKAPFIELDARIESEAGLTIGQIFELHGERHFRRLEHEALARLASEGRPMVVAAGGGLVTFPENWSLLRSTFRTVWLSADPEDHFERVLRQGDRRPMAQSADAMSELRAILDARRPLYGLADWTVDTSRLKPAQAVAAIERHLKAARGVPPRH